MKYYPAFLDLRDRPCLVIGRGQPASEKARMLRRAGAKVSRSATFQPEKSHRFFLIVAAVDEPATGRAVREFGDRNRIFVNVVDQTDHCSFIAPALVDRGNLLIAVSTSGTSPAYASKIRRQLEGQYGKEHSAVLRLLGEIRPRVKRRLDSFEKRKAFYSELVEDDLLPAHREGGRRALEALIEQKLQEHEK